MAAHGAQKLASVSPSRHGKRRLEKTPLQPDARTAVAVASASATDPRDEVPEPVRRRGTCDSR
ncbi:MAG: hypothetical protein ACREJR_00640 [Candidatus Rokuibacteriota bacterium]